MDYSKPYISSFYLTIVDPITWGDTDQYDIISGSISRTNSDLRQSASLTVDEWPYETDKIVRVYMLTKMNGEVDRVPMFTGIATSPSFSYNAGVPNIQIQCYSVLKTIDDILLPHGWYIKKGNRCLYEMEDLLSYSGAPVRIDDFEVEESYTLEDDIVAEDNETNLTMLEVLLASVGWVMYIEGDGTIVVSPSNEDPKIPAVDILSPRFDVIQSNFTVNHDWFDCPNCLRATFNEFTAIAKDEDEDDPLSVQNRGREIWVIESNVELLDKETIAEYADRRLKELQQTYETVSYNRCYLPNVNVENKLILQYQQLSGIFIVESQTITLGSSAVVNETIRRC